MGWSRFSKRYIWACNSRFLLYDKVERKLRRTKHNNALLWCSECLQCVQYGTQSTHRVAMATYWRTFHHDSNISPAGEDGGCTPSSFHSFYHHELSCVARSSWEITGPVHSMNRQFSAQLLYGLQFPLEICLYLHSFELFICGHGSVVEPEP
jgi:hypothetical protein